MEAMGIPTGLVVGSPRGMALLFRFGKDGKLDASGVVELPVQKWMSEYGDGLPPDAMLLVEHGDDAKGSGMALRLLDSGLLRDGAKAVTAEEALARGGFAALAETFRTEYLRRVFE